jgi:hypothetical protein
MTNDDPCLRYDPWGYDDSGYVELRDGMVTTRRVHDCAMCLGSIPAMSKVRAKTEQLDRNVKTFYFCPDCCDAMRKNMTHEDPDGLLVEHRTQIGIARSRERSEACPQP